MCNRLKQVIALHVKEASAPFALHMETAFASAIRKPEASALPISMSVLDEHSFTNKLIQATVNGCKPNLFSLLAKLVNNLLCGNVPPTYIVVCKDDNVVDYNNSLRLYDALLAKNIQNCELHVYEWGKHGFGMLNGPFMKEFKWNEPLLEWIKKIGMYE